MKFGGKQRNPNLENTKLTKTKSHENFFNKMLDMNKKLFRVVAFTFMSAAVLFSPKLLNATELVNQDLKGRKVYEVTYIDGSYSNMDSLNWIFERKNPSTEEWSAIQDTTYTIYMEGITYLCGDIVDTVFTPDSSHVYTYLKSAHTGLTAGDISIMYPDATIRGESIGTCTNWVESRTQHFTYPSWHMLDDYHTFFQVYADGSVDHNGQGGILFTYGGGEYTFRRSYICNTEEFTISIPLNMTETENKPQTIDLTVYPNPSNVNFKINFGENITGTLTIYDNNGRMIDSILLYQANEISINASGYSSGTYTARVETEEGNFTPPKKITIIK